jgi:TonB family protein
VLLFLSLFIALQKETGAQQQNVNALETDVPGIRLYRQGDISGAIDALRAAVRQRKDNSDAWHYLGLALNRNGELKEARKAFETAVKLRPGFTESHIGLAYTLLLLNKLGEAGRAAERAVALDPQIAEAHYVLGAVRLKANMPAKALDEAEAALRIRADLSPAHLLKTEALFGVYIEAGTSLGKEPSREARLKGHKEARLHLGEAAKSLAKYLALSPNAPNADFWRQQLEALRIHAGPVGGDITEDSTYSASEVTKATIRTRTEPQYTQAARQNGINGKVILLAVFASDGEVKHILVIRSLSHGLTEEAIKAARGIKFDPATKDGRPVSQFIQIEYDFHIH